MFFSDLGPKNIYFDLNRFFKFLDSLHLFPVDFLHICTEDRKDSNMKSCVMSFVQAHNVISNSFFIQLMLLGRVKDQ